MHAPQAPIIQISDRGAWILRRFPKRGRDWRCRGCLRRGVSVREKGAVAAHWFFRSALTGLLKHRFTETPAQWKRCFGVSVALRARCFGKRERVGRCARILSLFNYRFTETLIYRNTGPEGEVFRCFGCLRRGVSVREKGSVAAHWFFHSSLTGLLKHRNTETLAQRAGRGGR